MSGAASGSGAQRQGCSVDQWDLGAERAPAGLPLS